MQKKPLINAVDEVLSKAKSGFDEKIDKVQENPDSGPERPDEKASVKKAKKSTEDSSMASDAKWDDEWDEFTYEVTVAGGVFYEDDRDKTLNGPNGISSKDSKDSKVTLNKPFRTPDGPKKFSVYVKNEKGNVVKVNFGSPEKDMDIKRDDPERKKSFRARHKCDEQKDRTTPAYWSCKFWSNTKVSDMV